MVTLFFFFFFLPHQTIGGRCFPGSLGFTACAWFSMCAFWLLLYASRLVAAACHRRKAEGEKRKYASKDRCRSKISQDSINGTYSVPYVPICPEFDIITYNIILF
ncbi:hypothetical protein L873DRAFT_1005693 [Choiromyces venosus 120613-1]|uniref:Secreted protein n=1 Tax=Choiromyces venosus 120613-1 TaxID=1336337 RepID=A0A3N4JKA4_9PEZI|nr:hypothetical protein L873DRAFT_1005693 [Choiromyces venosus 120613-1]